MDRDWLKRELDDGRSIESIARGVGRHPSTVAYWVRKFGLESSHAERHRARGGISRDQLEPLVNSGMTIRAIADELGVGSATVRRWLDRHGLRTMRGARRVSNLDATEMLPDGDLMSLCPSHGWTRFRARTDRQGWRCLACRMKYVDGRRRGVKAG